MPSAPPGGARSPARRRSTRPTPTQRTPRTSAPARLGSSINPRYRRALSASPAYRRWEGPRKRRSSTPPRGRRGKSSSIAKALTAALALTASIKGAGGPYVGAPGKALATWPLGAVQPRAPTAASSYRYGALPPALAVEVLPTTRRKGISRKLFPGSHALTGMYEPRMVRREPISRKVTMGRGDPFPLPTITPKDVRYLENRGFIFPKNVHNQAQLGYPILGDKHVPNWAREPQYRRSVAALMSKYQPPNNKYSVPKQLALPAPVQRKLKTLENRAKAAAVEGTARAIAFPYKVAAKTRAATSYVFGLPGRVYAAVRGKYQNLRKAHSVARRRTVRPVS